MDVTTELLKQIPFSKLSVTQICQSAKIKRIAFYRQFDDKYQVLQSILAQVVDKNLQILNMDDFYRSPFETVFLTDFPQKIIGLQCGDSEFRTVLNDNIYQIVFDQTEDESLVWYVFQMISIADWYLLRHSKDTTSLKDIKKDVHKLDEIIRNKSFRSTFS